jgi:hypothetical protein
MPRSELFDYIFQLHGNDSPISAREVDLLFRLGKLPSREYLLRRFGGIAKLNEYLGYPDINEWDHADYVSYGAKVIELNGIGSLTARNIDTLAAHKLGPSTYPIKTRFGKLSTYQQLCLTEFRRASAIAESRMESINQHFSRFDHGDQDPAGNEERMTIWAKYHVAKDCLSSVSDRTLQELAILPSRDFVAELLAKNRRLNQADVEMVALSLDVSDYIWPPLNRREPRIPVQ